MAVELYKCHNSMNPFSLQTFHHPCRQSKFICFLFLMHIINKRICLFDKLFQNKKYASFTLKKKVSLISFSMSLYLYYLNSPTHSFNSFYNTPFSYFFSSIFFSLISPPFFNVSLLIKFQ